MRKQLGAWVGLVLALFVVSATFLSAQSTVTRRTDIFNFINGARVGGDTLTAEFNSIGNRQIPLATQTIVAAQTITSNTCGGIKRVTAAGAVTTNTTNTFSAVTSANAGCVMHVCNVGANAITLDANANFKSAAAGDVVLGAGDCLTVAADDAVWYQVSALLDN